MRDIRTASPAGGSEGLHSPRTQRASLPLSDGLVRDEELCRRVLDVITRLTACNGRPPTYREVLVSLGLSSHRRLSESLDDLVRTGRLQRLSGSRNMIVAIEPSRIASTP